MHGGTLPRWLHDKRMGENLKGKVKVASRQKTRWLGQVALIVERLVEDGQGEKIWALPEKIPGNRGKMRGREGSRESPLIRLISNYTLRKIEERGAGEALLRFRTLGLAGCSFFLVLTC